MWILVTGLWDDTGIWIDGDLWVDGPLFGMMGFLRTGIRIPVSTAWNQV